GSLKQATEALERFKFEELFLFELSMARIKHLNRKRTNGHIFEKTGPLTSAFFNKKLPFQLTSDQKHALRDIRNDVTSGLQMSRLIQGDVGSGKTVVAAGTMLMAVDNGFQATFMAPTEILAEQHYRTLSSFFDGLDIEIRMLKGKQKTKLRRDVLTSIEGGHCNIVVGTHAVIQESVQFQNLGLAIIDEQHRFGVKQRSQILQKGNHPHLLVMSATPIPRSLAMTIYSDLDISLIREMPAGRKPVKTAIRTEKKRMDLYRFLYANIKEGGQVYFVYPLIEESEALDLKDATLGFEKLKKHFPDFRIGLLHGRMESDEKESVMNSFVSGNLDILVTTTVIEVGVDVSNANVMIIEHAERFGLSQLHQLRGRIGRGTRQSYCILIPGDKISRDGRYRLQKMVETQDGFEIAEADLKLRGPGDFLGTKQSGLPDFKYADIVEDQKLLSQAKNYAWKITGVDPDLNQYDTLKKVFEPYFLEKSEFFESG
ncbi:MAG: ATP-dependent DNA helicase RecG, partial [Balneolaceae bacterium]